MLVTEAEYNDLHNDLSHALWQALWHQRDQDGVAYARNIPGLVAEVFEMAHKLLAKAGYTTTVTLEADGRAYYHDDDYYPGGAREEEEPVDCDVDETYASDWPFAGRAA